MKLKVEVRGYNFDECAGIYRRQSINLSNAQLCAGGEEGKVKNISENISHFYHYLL